MARVLIVDDEESIRLPFAAILTGIKYDVMTAADLIEAKDILASNLFDVALIDRILESHNGMDLVKHINFIQPFCTTILISAYPNFESASEGFKNNLFAYLQKPIKKEELLSAVKAAAQKSKEKQQFYYYEQQFLSYMRHSNGKFENIPIQSLMKEALVLLRIAVPKTINIQEKIGDGNDIVFVNPTQIQQVILNIGINAMHAMENKTGTIEVSIEQVQFDIESMKSFSLKNRGGIKISMKDTGCGMDEKTLKQIFDPFFTTRPKGLGTGIGLSVTSTILKNHGGRITAQSQPGNGSSFHMYLPIIDK
jgi:signal transduction histidine kinase